MPKENRVRLWLIALVFGSVEFLAASPTGSITGFAKDPSAAVIPGVKITLTNLATGARLTSTTDANGAYQFPQLPPASYSLVAEAAGLKKAGIANILVDVDQVTRADIALEIGSQTEVVEVASVATSVATLFESDKSTRSSVVDRRTIANMPLNARQFLVLALLTAETADAPVIINNSRHRILAYALMVGWKGQPRPLLTSLVGMLRNHPMSSAGIASGATFAHNSIRRPQTYDANGQATNALVGFTSVWLDAVVFDDGSVIGPDRSGTFEQVSAQIKAEQDINSILSEGDLSESAWSKIKAIASGQFPGPPPAGSPLYQSRYLSMEKLHAD